MPTSANRRCRVGWPIWCRPEPRRNTPGAILTKVQAVIETALAQILAAGRTAGTLVNDENVEHYLAAGVRFFMTGWTNWVAQGARAYVQKVAAKS